MDRFLDRTTRLPYLVRGLPEAAELDRMSLDERLTLARGLVQQRARQLKVRA